MALGLLRIPQVVALVFGGRERPFSKCHASAVRLRGPEALALAARDGEGLARDLVESLLAVSDYQAFVELMQRVARQCEADSCTGEASPA
ncbi:unnamed protein product, partial [Durusdinium trenchii]